jgi:tetratricopeptide (TPR) repeat protein
MKKTIVAGVLSLTGLLNAQTLPETIKKTDNENFDAAAASFRQLIAKEPAKGEYYFYYGENYFKSDDVDSANIFYQKGVELNATNPLNYVGLGKVLLAKGNTADAKAQFYKAATLGGAKNAEVMRRTAEAWLATDNKNADEALALAANAVKIEPKNPENHLILGDAQLEKRLLRLIPKAPRVFCAKASFTNAAAITSWRLKNIRRRLALMLPLPLLTAKLQSSITWPASPPNR